MSSRHLGQYKGNFYIIDEVLIANLSPGPGYTDAFSNCSVFISLRFQIDPIWLAFSESSSSFPCEQEVKTQRYHNRT